MIRTCLDPEWQPPKYADGSVWRELPRPKEGTVQLDGAPSVAVEDERIERMWVNDTIGATVSASEGRLVLSFSEFVPEKLYEAERALVQRMFRADTDEPAWEWRRGNDKVEIAKKAGTLPKWMIMEPRWIWHFMDPEATL